MPISLPIFHLYGLIIGLSIWLTIALAEKKAKSVITGQTVILGLDPRIQFSLNVFWQVIFWELAGGVIGARLYHVITDWPVYQSNFWHIFLIWQGGLSIIGAVIGAAIALWLYLKLHQNLKLKWQLFADLAVFGAPFGQAFGRLGNYVNQELYGLPTNLPWAIYIDPAHRLAGFQNFAYYHPLFFYEMILMFIFGLWVWRQKWQIGSGQLFWIYVAYYSFIRFWLDFLRIDKANIIGTQIGANQAFLLVVFLIGLFFYFCSSRANCHSRESGNPVL